MPRLHRRPCLEVVARFVARWSNATVDNVRRWFVEAPIVGDGMTWLLANQSSPGTETTLHALAGLAGDGSVGVIAVD